MAARHWPDKRALGLRILVPVGLTVFAVSVENRTSAPQHRALGCQKFTRKGTSMESTAVLVFWSLPISRCVGSLFVEHKRGSVKRTLGISLAETGAPGRGLFSHQGEDMAPHLGLPRDRAIDMALQKKTPNIFY